MSKPAHAVLVSALLTGLLVAMPALAADQDGKAANDREAIEAVLERYFAGHATGDPAHMRQAFLPTAHIEGIRNGRFTSWTLDEYCALFNGKPAADEATRVRTVNQVDAAGNAGMARATLVHGTTVFTDYFVLLKSDGEWRIANKVYASRPANP